MSRSKDIEFKPSALIWPLSVRCRLATRKYVHKRFLQTHAHLECIPFDPTKPTKTNQNQTTVNAVCFPVFHGISRQKNGKARPITITKTKKMAENTLVTFVTPL